MGGGCGFSSGEPIAPHPLSTVPAPDEPMSAVSWPGRAQPVTSCSKIWEGAQNKADSHAGGCA